MFRAKMCACQGARRTLTKATMVIDMTQARKSDAHASEIFVRDQPEKQNNSSRPARAVQSSFITRRQGNPRMINRLWQRLSIVHQRKKLEQIASSSLKIQIAAHVDCPQS